MWWRLLNRIRKIKCNSLPSMNRDPKVRESRMPFSGPHMIYPALIWLKD